MTSRIRGSIVALALAASGCKALGYSSDVLWRLPSPDGRLLAVLSGHVARARFIDVEWALAHPNTTTAYWSWRVVDLGSEHRPFKGGGIRFVSPTDVELQDGVPRRFTVPAPVVTGHRPGV